MRRVPSFVAPAAPAWAVACSPLLLSLGLIGAHGAASAQSQVADCTALVNDAARLVCYDRLHQRVLPVPAAAPAAAQAAQAAVRAVQPAAVPAAQPAAVAVSRPPRSHLAERWDLDSEGDTLFAPRPYRPVYLLPATWTDRINRRPNSPAPLHAVTTDQPLQASEAKYQLSLKAKLGQNLLGTPVDLWGGYTQSSRWQVYNGAASRPFRETNYEPELMLTVPLRTELLGWQLRVAGVSLNHQSNGRALPLSRSWNRVIGMVAAERGEWVAEFRPWARLPERAQDDDNPGIADYVGRAELRVSRYWGDQALLLQFRHSMRGGAQSRGSAQVDWVFPLSGALHGYLQAFNGYGESLVDYNLQQTKIGLGVSIAGWR